MKHYGAFFVAKGVLFALGIADIAMSWWLTEVLTLHRPLTAGGAYLTPYQAHGSVTYISSFDNGAHIALMVGAALLAIAWWLLTRLEKHLDGQPRSR